MGQRTARAVVAALSGESPAAPGGTTEPSSPGESEDLTLPPSEPAGILGT